MNLNKGISTPIAILIIVVVAALAGGVFYWQYSSLKNTEITQVTVPQTLQQSEPSESLKTPTTTKPVDTSDWKTYRNIEYDYQLKVPQDFQNRAKPSAWVGESNDDRISLDKGHQWYITINYDPGAPFWNPPSDAELVSWLRENEVLFGDYQTLDKPNFEIGGIPAVKMYYPGRPQSFNYDIIYFIKDNKLFELHALADADRENNMSAKEVKEICKEILSTLEFIE